MWAKHTNKNDRNRNSGFTIVELLIVIVVIAILAAITIVAYNGIQSRAKAAAAQSALSQAQKQIMLYAVRNNDEYPPTLEAAEVKSSTTASYEYTPPTAANPKSYCLTATASNLSYKSADNSDGSPGACPGHGLNGRTAITNLSTNPGFESSQSGTAMVWSASPTRIAGAAISGSMGLRINCAAGGNTDCGVNLGPSISVVAGKTYTYRVTIRALNTGSYATYVTANSGVSSKIYTNQLDVGDTWTFNITKEATGTGLATWYVLRTTTSASSYDVDSVIVTEGDNTYQFADGNTPGWIWNGTANSATSTGSPV